VDLGSSYCKLAFVDGVRASVSQESIEPSARFFDSNGYSALCAHLRALVHEGQPNPPAGLALALPFEVDYRRNSIASNWRGGWPDSVRSLEAALADELALPCIVLNDAVRLRPGVPSDAI
jgi:predicted NBD/HSP70 family sugar kinase